MEEAELHRYIEQYLSLRVDDEAAEDRWRTKMMKRFTAQLSDSQKQVMMHVDEQVARLDAKLTRLYRSF